MLNAVGSIFRFDIIILSVASRDAQSDSDSESLKQLWVRFVNTNCRITDFWTKAWVSGFDRDFPAGMISFWRGFAYLAIFNYTRTVSACPAATWSASPPPPPHKQPPHTPGSSRRQHQLSDMLVIEASVIYMPKNACICRCRFFIARKCGMID